MAYTCWVNLNRLGHATGSRVVCGFCLDPRHICLRGPFLYKKTFIRYILWLHWYNDKYINILSWTIFLDLRVYFSSDIKGMKRFSWALKVVEPSVLSLFAKLALLTAQNLHWYIRFSILDHFCCSFLFSFSLLLIFSMDRGCLFPFSP